MADLGLNHDKKNTKKKKKNMHANISFAKKQSNYFYNHCKIQAGAEDG